jgi:hypothetical protein
MIAATTSRRDRTDPVHLNCFFWTNGETNSASSYMRKHR